MRLTLHVVNRVVVLDVSVETEDRHSRIAIIAKIAVIGRLGGLSVFQLYPKVHDWLSRNICAYGDPLIPRACFPEKQQLYANQGLDTRVKGQLHSNVYPFSSRALYTGPFMPDNYFARYIPLLIQIIVAMALAGVMILLSYLVGKHKWTPVKNSPYECGIVPTGDAQQRFSVKFYMVAMLFILFDVEAIFLYPWAVIARDLKMFGFWEMLVYIGLVLVGFFYIWKKGIIDWNKPERSEG